MARQQVLLAHRIAAGLDAFELEDFLVFRSISSGMMILPSKTRG